MKQSISQRKIFERDIKAINYRNKTNAAGRTSHDRIICDQMRNRIYFFRRINAGISQPSSEILVTSGVKVLLLTSGFLSASELSAGFKT